MHARTLVIGLFLLASVGCTPEWAAWSPDGSKLLVATDTSVHVVDADFQHDRGLDIRTFGLTPAVWAGDSNELLVIERRPIDDWKAIEPLLSLAERVRIEKLADEMLADLQAHEGDWQEFKLQVDARRSEIVLTWIYLRDHAMTELRRILGGPAGEPVDWTTLEMLKIDRFAVKLATVTDRSLEVKKTIHESFDAIASIRVAPNGKAYARVEESGPQPELPLAQSIQPSILLRSRLVVQDIAGESKPLEIAQDVNWWPSWSPDGSSIFYVTNPNRSPLNEDSPGIGILKRCDLSLSPKGEAILVGHSELVDVIFSPIAKLAALGDGSILFPGRSITLPSLHARPSPENMPDRLYRFHPDGEEGITPVVLSETSEDIAKAIALGSFNVDPTGTQLLISTPSGRTGVASLADGSIQWSQPIEVDDPQRGEAWKYIVPSAPIWRTDKEWTYLIPTGIPSNPGSRAEFAHQGKNGSTVISTDWTWFDLKRAP